MHVTGLCDHCAINPGILITLEDPPRYMCSDCVVRLALEDAAAQQLQPVKAWVEAWKQQWGNRFPKHVMQKLFDEWAAEVKP